MKKVSSYNNLKFNRMDHFAPKTIEEASILFRISKKLD